MTYRLSLLDKSQFLPEASGDFGGAQALQTTLDIARRADALGYHRYWLAEHHGIPGLASAAPEVLISHILAQTRRIRVGSGGVLLQHYAPYKIAEIFAVLASLAPGRVDLGVGKSPGAFPQVTRALQAELATGSAGSVDRKLQELAAWLRGPVSGADIQPRPRIVPQPFLLGASVASAQQAARLGWDFVYAGHQQGDRAATLAALSAYEAIAGRRPIVALAAFAAPTRAEALDRVGDVKIVRPVFDDGHVVNLTSEAAAHEYARQYGSTAYTLETRSATVLAGTPDDVRGELAALAAELDVSEFILDQPVTEPAARLKSVELIATPASRAVA